MTHKPSAKAKRVWLRLVQWYGIRILEQYGQEPPEDWCEAVDRADNATIQRGLDQIRAKHPDHPPTFPQFESLMKPAPRNNQRRCATQDELLTQFAVRQFWSRLTPKQQRGGWRYTGEAVIIEADGDSPQFRASITDMGADQQELR